MKDIWRIKLLSGINRLIPKKINQIAIYGRRMLNDNSAALLDYLIKEGYNAKYTIKVCLAPNVPHEDYLNILNVEIVTNPLKTFYTLFNSMCMFHTHGMTTCAVIPCGKQVVFNLWHGSPLKSIGVAAGDKRYPETDSYFLCASPFMANLNKKCFLINDKQVFIGSNPRNDLLFSKSENLYLKKLKGNKKVVLYMPTFRNSTELGRSDSHGDFPILSLDNIGDFDNFLEYKNILFIIKPHPYQNDIELFNEKYNNIVVLKNEDLGVMKLPLYELLGQSDALISDFSSVYFDYMLLDKPIGFVIEDMNDYGSSRGFTVDRPLDLMPGNKINNLADLKKFILNVSEGVDLYKDDRRKINDLCNTYKTPDASKRILDFLGIKK